MQSVPHEGQVQLKILIDYKKKDSGAGKFFQRLMREFNNMGHLCKYKIGSPDVHIAPIYFRQKQKANVSVLRVDGVHFSSGEGKMHRNNNLRKCIKIADGVIYQSAFSKKFCERIMKVEAKRSVIINNGVDPSDYDVVPYPKTSDKIVIVSARYASDDRKQKRMKDIAKIALHYVSEHKDVTFWFCGKYKGVPPKHERIKFFGNVPEAKLCRMLKAADVMLHLAWYDWCPNAVVESLVAGTPVICTNQGGTKELVRERGIVLPTDKPIRPEVVKSYNPPRFNYDLVYDALDKILVERPAVNAPDLHISEIAKQYLSFFRELQRR